MADQADVENSLVTLIAATLYPNGTAQPSTVGVDCRIYRGWPNAPALDADLAAGKLNVSVFPRNGVERNTSRYPAEWQTSIQPVHTLTATVSGNTVTIGGTVSTPQNVAIVANQKAWSYGVQATDTLTSIATGLATLVAADFPGTTNSGPVITLGPAIGTVQARVGGSGTSWRELKRQEKHFQITLWCPTPQLRDQAANAVDPALALNRFITLADNSAAFVRYHSSLITDEMEKFLLYRRDLIYAIEYPTTQTRTDYEIVAHQTQIQGEATITGTLPIPATDTPVFGIES